MQLLGLGLVQIPRNQNLNRLAFPKAPDLRDRMARRDGGDGLVVRTWDPSSARCCMRRALHGERAHKV